VVPIDPETEHEWLHPPFSGAVADGFVWGRGTLDVKVGVVSILEAVQALIESGFRPRRTVLLAFGHDEEVSGLQGALKIVQHLRQRNVTLEFVLDEGTCHAHRTFTRTHARAHVGVSRSPGLRWLTGGSMTSGILKQVSKTVALVGIAEKARTGHPHRRTHAHTLTPVARRVI
jgi:carboxypeptidase PM20D1